jgi:hypothetical protein
MEPNPSSTTAGALSAAEIAAAAQLQLPTETLVGATFLAGTLSHPAKPGFAWIVHWGVTEPTGEDQGLQFTILDSHQAALDFFKQAVGALNAVRRRP